MKQRKTIKQVKEINKTVQDLKIEIEEIKKTEWGEDSEMGYREWSSERDVK